MPGTAKVDTSLKSQSHSVEKPRMDDPLKASFELKTSKNHITDSFVEVKELK